MRHWQTLLIVPLVLFLVLMIFINQVSPGEAGPAGILLVFLLLYSLSLSVCFWAVYVGPGVLARLGIARKRSPLSIRKAYYIASVVAALPLLLITIQSVNQLRIWDVLLVVTLLSLAVFYVNRRF